MQLTAGVTHLPEYINSVRTSHDQRKSQIFISAFNMPEEKKARISPQNANFTLFPQLPKELRLKVWEFACHEPRIVEVCLPYPEHSRDWITAADPDADEDEDDDENGDDGDDSAESWEGQKPVADPNAFYSPSALPTILHVNQESRAIALRNYTSPFPSIYFHPSVDMLYFPAWCFEYSIHDFEDSTPATLKHSIQRVALDNLVWNASWSEGYINNQIKLSEFGNLREFWLVRRRPDKMGCGCCHDFDGPEEGEVQLVDMKGGYERRLGDVVRAFGKIREKDSGWKTPEFKFMQLMRNGAFV